MKLILPNNKRNVIFHVDTAESGLDQSALGLQVTRICAIFSEDNGEVELGLYNDEDEYALLTRFWLAIRANDRIFAQDVELKLTLLRQRSWHLDVLPSWNIDLRQVYCHDVVDMRRRQ